MIKRIATIVVGIVMILMLCSCDSEEVKQAKAAYEEGDYAKTVELLSKEKDLDQDAKDILIISEANVLYKDGKYLDAVKKLVSCSQGTQAEQFEEMFTAALDDAIKTHSADNVVELLSIDETKADVVFDTVTKACKDRDYNGFLVLEGLVEKLEDGDLKTKLSDFGKEYANLKAEAFMVGTWEWQEDEKKLTQVEVVPYNKNLIGRVTQVGTKEEDYHYKKDDMYWQDFKFEDDKSFICYNLTKTEEGDVLGETASGTINYEKGTIEINVTGAVTPIRKWKRLDK